MSRDCRSTHTTTGTAASPARLPATLRLGAVHLTVTDLDRSVAFYEDAIGLRLHRREDSVAAMGAGDEDLLVFYEEPTARRGEESRSKARPGLVIGHIHLHVGNLERGLGFYRDVVGFELMTFMPGAAAFVSAGSYHHHLGFNTWRGEGVPPVLEGRVGLRHWTVVLDDSEEVAAVRERVRAAGIATEERGGGFLVRDPWEIAVLFVTPEGLRA